MDKFIRYPGNIVTTIIFVNAEQDHEALTNTAGLAFTNPDLGLGDSLDNCTHGSLVPEMAERGFSVASTLN
jgi:hypothetical protein